MSSGRGRVYKQSNSSVWWIDYSVRGKRYRESSGSRRKKDAQKLLDQRIAERAGGNFIGPDAEKVTFDDLATMIEDDYKANHRKSLDRTKLSIQHLRDFFGAECRAVDITTDRITRYINARQEDNAANATIKRELAALKRMFRLAVRAGRLPRAPHVPSIQVDNARTGFLDGKDLERVISELPEPLRPVVRFAAMTGWRKGEILSLTWAQVDFDAGVVRLEPGTTKNKEGRSFPFSALPPLATLMEEQREHTRAIEKREGRIIPHVFHRDGERIKSMRTAWNGATRRAKVPDAVFHDLRRTAVRNLERAGVSRSAAMKLTGHKTEAIYRRYAIVESAMLEEGVQKLARLYAHRQPDAAHGSGA